MDEEERGLNRILPSWVPSLSHYSFNGGLLLAQFVVSDSLTRSFPLIAVGEVIIICSLVCGDQLSLVVNDTLAK